MKLIAPEGVTSISFEGEDVAIDKTGACEVSGRAAKHLMDSFGFRADGAKPAADEPKPILDKFADMSRAELIGYIKSKSLPVAPQTDNDTLRATARSQYSPEERAADEKAAAAALAAAEAAK